MRDALFHFAEAGLFRARWSTEILQEWHTALLKSKPLLAESLASQMQAIERVFPEACVDGYQDLIQALHLPDPNDRHVLAAAIVADAEHIITENIKDFPESAIAKYGIEAVTADDFLARTFELYPAEATAALRTMRRNYENPPLNPGEFVFDLQTKGMPNLASMLKQHIDVI
jgi:predicted nucleic acid-binding protein